MLSYFAKYAKIGTTCEVFSYINELRRNFMSLSLPEISDVSTCAYLRRGYEKSKKDPTEVQMDIAGKRWLSAHLATDFLKTR
jgi:hypothetical protein